MGHHRYTRIRDSLAAQKTAKSIQNAFIIAGSVLLGVVLPFGAAILGFMSFGMAATYALVGITTGVGLGAGAYMLARPVMKLLPVGWARHLD